MAVDIAKRQGDRLRVLRAIFEAADGTTSEVVRIAPTIQMQLGLSDQEVEAACDYLAGKRLIKPLAKVAEAPVYIAVELTHLGVTEMEELISAPEKPTKYLSAASIVMIVNSTVVNSAIQNASPEGRQIV